MAAQECDTLLRVVGKDIFFLDALLFRSFDEKNREKTRRQILFTAAAATVNVQVLNIHRTNP
jgi:hypothetical protein